MAEVEVCAEGWDEGGGRWGGGGGGGWSGEDGWAGAEKGPEKRERGGSGTHRVRWLDGLGSTSRRSGGG